MPTPTFTKTGSKATVAAKLDKAVFDVEVKNHELIKQAYTAYLANGRENLAKTLTRGKVRGGGRKPWKQKGTGRARFGSIRVPIWRGGGVVFGPLGSENYSRKITTKAKRQAIRQALSLNKDNVIVIETFECKDGKTAQAAQFLDKIGAKRNVLLVVSEKDALVERATANLSGVKAVQAMYVNVYDVMNADYIVITAKAQAIIEQWLGATAKATAKEAK